MKRRTLKMIKVNICSLERLSEKLKTDFKNENNIGIVLYPWAENSEELMWLMHNIECGNENLKDTKFYMFDYNKEVVKDIELKDNYFNNDIANHMAEYVLNSTMSYEDCNIIIIETNVTIKADAVASTLWNNLVDTEECGDYIRKVGDTDTEDTKDFNRIVTLLSKALDRAFTKLKHDTEIELKLAKEMENAITNCAENKENDIYNEILVGILDNGEVGEKIPTREEISKHFNCSIMTAINVYTMLINQGYIDEDGVIISHRMFNEAQLHEMEHALRDVIKQYKENGIPQEDLVGVINYFLKSIYEDDSKETVKTSIDTMSSEEIEAYAMNKNKSTSAIISIYSSGGRKADIKLKEYNLIKDVLYLKIDDATRDDGYSLIMTDHEGDEVVDFVYKWLNKVDTIIFQCEYGESRSVGCAEAVMEMLLNSKFDDEKTLGMNRHCYNTVKRAFKRHE